ncbi:uncharacterized protein LOC116601415 [Nematostella vectensis]|uniref:uncharacterized protein LOC116601415 n=1 Tax=Nematostella vectensis TaxID=45351 RepID=UPI00139040FD|nr:uncharacterized protein LOC116601415 [Nematostella vectensis]
MFYSEVRQRKMMLKQICVLVAFCVFSAKALKWKNCDSSAPVQIKVVSVSPEPISLEKGKQITFSGNFVVNKVTGNSYHLEISRLYRKGWLWWTPVPCFGLCPSIDLTCKELSTINPAQKEQCPLPVQAHSIPKQTITLPSIPIPSFLTSGTWSARFDLKDNVDKSRVACVDVEEVTLT